METTPAPIPASQIGRRARVNSNRGLRAIFAGTLAAACCCHTEAKAKPSAAANAATTAMRVDVWPLAWTANGGAPSIELGAVTIHGRIPASMT
jgi:hypothetical protein